MEQPVIDKAPEALLARGGDALRAGKWELARVTFQALVALEPTAAAHEGLSWAAWWQDDADATLEGRETAFNLYTAGGDKLGAARMAVWLANDYFDFRGETAISNGWLQIGTRLLEDLPTAAEHGWLAILRADMALLVEEDALGARQFAQQAIAIGRQVADHDLELMGRTIEGVSLVTEGDIPQGMSRLDEAAVGALGGRTELLFTVSFVLCHLVYACELARDFDRATQWCSRLREYSDQMGFAFAQGTCRAHYASILLWRGMWKEAETELNDASRLLARSRPPWESEARVRLAELRRRQGRAEEAEALFQEVSWHPLAPLGLAELSLSSGRTTDAGELLDQMLRSLPPASAASRAAALDVLVRVRIAAGDIDGARVAWAELNEIAARVDTLAMKAACHALRGHIALAAADYDESRRCFEDAAVLFTRCKAPYETALSRLGLANALQHLEREQRAKAEAELALKSFRSLGAFADAEAAAAILTQNGAYTAGESVLTPRQIDVLRLIARGMSDREIAIELVMSEHTVHRHVANILQRLNLPSRAAAVGHASAHGWL